MIFKNSRYTNTPVSSKSGLVSFKLRTRFKFNLTNAKVHQYSLGETLDGLALHYYQDSQLWWVFLEANTQYKTLFDVKYGDNLIVPSYEEVMLCLNY